MLKQLRLPKIAILLAGLHLSSSAQINAGPSPVQWGGIAALIAGAGCGAFAAKKFFSYRHEQLRTRKLHESFRDFLRDKSSSAAKILAGACGLALIAGLGCLAFGGKKEAPSTTSAAPDPAASATPSVTPSPSAGSNPDDASTSDQSGGGGDANKDNKPQQPAQEDNGVQGGSGDTNKNNDQQEPEITPVDGPKQDPKVLQAPVPSDSVKDAANPDAGIPENDQGDAGEPVVFDVVEQQGLAELAMLTGMLDKVKNMNELKKGLEIADQMLPEAKRLLGMLSHCFEGIDFEQRLNESDFAIKKADLIAKLADEKAIKKILAARQMNIKRMRERFGDDDRNVLNAYDALAKEITSATDESQLAELLSVEKLKEKYPPISPELLAGFYSAMVDSYHVPLDLKEKKLQLVGRCRSEGEEYSKVATQNIAYVFDAELDTLIDKINASSSIKSMRDLFEPNNFRKTCPCLYELRCCDEYQEGVDAWLRGLQGRFYSTMNPNVFYAQMRSVSDELQGMRRTWEILEALP